MSQPYLNARGQHVKNENQNFATVTANTGNMIVSNLPITTKIDSTMTVVPSQPVKQNNRLNNKSNCFSEHKNTVVNPQTKVHSQGSKYNQQNHHTLQCISDINDFKQKINMVLQTQAFPSKGGPNPIETIPSKQIAGNAPGSLNPSSRIGYLNPKHESPTPNLNKNHFFQKRKVTKQGGQNQLGEMYDMIDSKNEQIVNQAFQSFKQNLKQQHQQFIKSTNVHGSSQTVSGKIEHNQIYDSKSQGSVMQDSIKLTQTGGTYLLRSQKDKNRNQFQLQQQNAQTNPFQSNAEIPQTLIKYKIPVEASMQQKMLNAHIQNSQAKPTSNSLNKKQYISNMMQNQNDFGNYMPPSQTQTGNQKSSQRRKLLIEYGNEHANLENVSSKLNMQKQPSPVAASSSNPRHNRSSVFSQNEYQKLKRSDLFDTLESLNLDLMDDKDRESMKHFAMLYLADLKRYLEHKNTGSEDQSGIGNAKLTTELANRQLLNSREGVLSGSQKSAALNAMITDTKVTTPKKEAEGSLNPLPGSKSIHDDSAEKFKLNEKNLKEERLRKESKIELSLTLENRKVPKSTTPGQGVNVNGEDEAKSKELPQEPTILSVDINAQTNLKRNVSQKQIASIITQEMTETEGSILFKTENNRLRKMMGRSHEDQSPTTNEDSIKINMLSQLIEDLEKPKLALSMSRQASVNRGSNLHYAHTSDKHPVDVYGMFQNNNSANAKEQSSTLEWLQNITPIKMFLASLNCQKPTPQQINVMNNSKQRLDLFKILQAREHVKFTNIQSEKMLQLHQKLEEDLESRNKAQSDLKGSDSQKFVDYVSRNGQEQHQKNIEILSQYQQKQITSMQNLQQLKNMRKQQQNDQKAFSIFQLNELAQFRSMSDGQQKQILLNNLQQGKFDEFENLLDPISSGSAKSTQITQSTADGISNNNSSKLTKSGARSLEHTNENLKKSNLRQVKQIVDEAIKPNFDLKIEDLASNTKTNVDATQRRSMMTSGLDKVGSQDNITTQGPGSVRMLRYYKNNNVQSEQITQRPANEVVAPETNADNLHVIRRKELEQIQSNFEASEGKFKTIIKENMLKQQKVKIFYQQMNEAFVNYIHTNKFYQQIQNVGVGLDHMLPYLQKSTIPGSTNDFDDKARARIKARQSMGLSNINQNHIQRQIDRSKSKQNINGIRETTNNLNEKKKDLTLQNAEPVVVSGSGDTKDVEAKKEGEAADGEEPVQEVKKPRYFPPKKLPNPFENAAQEQEKFLQARKEALAKYSQISKNRFKQDENAPLKYVIRPGNNSKLIQRVFEKSGRIESKYDNDGNISCPGWETADDYLDSLYNFKWKPTSGGIKFDQISKHGLKQLVNHIQGHQSLTTKDNLFINMKGYYETQRINIYDMVPFTIVLDYLKDDVSDKVEMFYNILKLVDKHIDQEYEVINQKLQELQIQREKTVKSQYKISRSMHDRQNLWLLKPTGFNRGIGIHIFQTFDQLKDIMCTYYGIGRGAKDKASIFQTHKQNHVTREQQQETNGEKQMRNFSFVIQKLIERPLLYLNRKFDIRTLVILNSSDGKVYQFIESYVRTSSTVYQEYDPDLAIEDQIFMQLTNNAVQKEGPEYGKFEEGNIISLDTLFNYVSQSSGQSKSKAELKNRFLTDAKQSIIDSMKSVKGKIVQQKYTFELFGYDFIIDEDMNTYLIEVNTNPCLEESNTILKNMLPRMIDDLMNITMDPLFFPSESNKYKSAFPLPGYVFQDPNLKQNKLTDSEPHPGYRDNENLFKHIYTLEQ